MTVDEYNKSLSAKIQAIEKENKPLLIAVKSTQALQSKRIFIDGLNASNGIIGEYSDNEVYVSPIVGVRKFPLKGKSGQDKFKNGAQHKSGYFKNWLAFKTGVGRNKNIKTVDLFLSGALSQDWSNSTIVNSPEPRKINANRYVITLKNFNLKKTFRYGNVFGISKFERESFFKVINFELIKALK